MGAIYLIRNDINGKCYIGKSVNDPLTTRIKPHLKGYGGNKLLSDDVKKYGPANFSWEILHHNIDDDDVLDNYEVKAIEKHRTIAPHGYNLTRGGDGAGRHLSTSCGETIAMNLINNPSLHQAMYCRKFAELANRKFAELGLKKGYVAECVGIAPETLSRILKAKHNPSLSVAVSLSYILEFSLDDIKDDIK